jgi:hypothetical protein
VKNLRSIGQLFKNFIKNLKVKPPSDGDFSENGEFPDFVESTGYGTGGGLCGWNCRHNFVPFDPKFMKNNLKEYDLKENEKVYNLTQKQRLFERNIRKLRRKLILEKSAGIDASQTKIKLTKKIKKYEKFCKENDLKTQFERTQIGD